MHAAIRYFHTHLLIPHERTAPFIMIRFIIIFVCVVLFLIVSLPIQFVLFIIGKFNPEIKGRVSLAIVGWAFRCVKVISGVDLTVIGEENVPKDRPVLYISNHRSYYDVILTYYRVPRQTGYIAKDVMARIPSFSRWMRYMHCLFLDRSDIKKGMQTIKDAIDLINNGISVHVCPEGTRNKTDEPLQEFHKGTFKIAERTGCTIIPVTINNSESIYEKQRPRIVPSKVILEYGKPIETAGLTRDEKKQLCENVREIILETYLKNQKLLEADK